MKILFIILLSIIFIALAYFIYLGFKSQTGSAIGLIDGKLSPCPDKPNCICTEYPSHKTLYAGPIEYKNISTDKVITVIENIGGTITKKDFNYIAATFTSKLFRYVDDFEIRLDTDNQLLHIRSASRVGYSDMGANLKRIETFEKTLKEN